MPCDVFLDSGFFGPFNQVFIAIGLTISQKGKNKLFPVMDGAVIYKRPGAYVKGN